MNRKMSGQPRRGLRWATALLKCAIGGFLLASGAIASAAVTDCAGMSIDGQAQCIPPNYSPTQYQACYIGSSFLFKDSAMEACARDLGLSNPLLSEADAVALTNCADKRLAPSGHGVTGPVPWLPVGTDYNDNFCFIGKVRDLEGHHLWGVGDLGGSFQSYAYHRGEPASCPAGYTEVSQNIDGFTTLVRCKPNPPCPPDEVISPTRPGVCLKKADIFFCFHCLFGISDPIYPLTGTKRETIATGFRLSGAELSLTYDTVREVAGLTVRPQPSFGKLWSSSLHKTLGIGTGATVVTAFRGDGSVVTFTLRGGVYVADANINDVLVAFTGGYRYTDASTKQVETYSAQGQLSRIDGASGSSLSFTYSTAASAQAPAAGYLTQVTDNNGRTLNFQYVLPSGASIVLAATKGQISSITESGGRSLAFAYDTNFNLATLTWPDNKTVQFLYEDAEHPWAMTGRIDENGSRFATWSYDSQGMANSVSLALGADAYTVAYETPPQYSVTETEDTTLNILYRIHLTLSASGISINTPNGQSIGWNSTSILGAAVLTGATQPAGSGSGAAASAQAYDAAGNVISKDDFQGTRTCYVYDSSNRETVRVEGLANTVSCGSVTPVGASVPVGARKITTVWHTDWRLPVQVNEPLRRTTTVYHGQPDPLNGNVIANCTSAAALPNGKPIPLVCKQATQALLSTGALDPSAAANTTQFTYDAAGRVLTTADANNRVTSYVYYADTAFTGADPNAVGHTAGDLQTITNPSGHVTQYTQFDKQGRVRQSVDPKGVVTDFTYTARGWVDSVSVSAAGLAPRVTSYAYDNSGQRTQVNLPDGTTLGYGYDAAHRLTSILDSRGNSVTYTLDASGNRTAEEVRDPTGALQRSITRSFDALNRVQQVSGASM